jgi:hypothetical protein
MPFASTGATILRINPRQPCFADLAGIRLQPVAGQAWCPSVGTPATGARLTNPRRAFYFSRFASFVRVNFCLRLDGHLAARTAPRGLMLTEKFASS